MYRRHWKRIFHLRSQRGFIQLLLHRCHHIDAFIVKRHFRPQCAYLCVWDLTKPLHRTALLLFRFGSSQSVPICIHCCWARTSAGESRKRIRTGETKSAFIFFFISLFSCHTWGGGGVLRLQKFLFGVNWSGCGCFQVCSFLFFCALVLSGGLSVWMKHVVLWSFDFARHFQWMDGLNCASGLDTDSKSRRLCVIAHLQHQTSDSPPRFSTLVIPKEKGKKYFELFHEWQGKMLLIKLMNKYIKVRRRTWKKRSHWSCFRDFSLLNPTYSYVFIVSFRSIFAAFASLMCSNLLRSKPTTT